MTLQRAKEITNGGAIFNEGNLFLKDVILKDNFEGAILKPLTNNHNLDIHKVVEIQN